MDHSDTVQRVKENLKLTYYPAEFPGFTRESREKHDLAMEVIDQLKFILQLDHPKGVNFSFNPHKALIGYDALSQIYMYAITEIAHVIYGRKPLEYQFPNIKGEILKVIEPEKRAIFEHSHNPILLKIEKKVSEILTKYFDEYFCLKEFREQLEPFKKEYQHKSDTEKESHKQRLILEIKKREGILDDKFSIIVKRFDTREIKTVPIENPVFVPDDVWNNFNTIDKYHCWYSLLIEFAESQKQSTKVIKPFEDEPQYLKNLLTWGMKCEPCPVKNIKNEIINLLDETYQYAKTIRLLKAKIQVIDELLLNDLPVLDESINIENPIKQAYQKYETNYWDTVKNYRDENECTWPKAYEWIENERLMIGMGHRKYSNFESFDSRRKYLGFK